MPDAEGTINEDIVMSIAIGQDVYDRESRKVGAVDSFDAKTGWMTVDTSPWYDRSLFLPFSLVTNIDRRELYVSRTKDELTRDYSTRPPRTTRVAVEGGKTVATTTEPSGYDGSPAVVQRVDLDQVRNRIATGDRVWTSDLVEVGRVKQYDPATGLMMVEKGAFTRRDMMVPIAIVEDVESETRDVSLVASEADLRRMEHVEPVSVVVVAAEATT